MDNRVSVIMSVYENDNALWFNEAVESMVLQSHRPDEIVIIVDGPIAKPVKDVLANWVRREPGLFKIIDLKENSGLGIALKRGVEAASYGLVARMDSDDISVSTRLEQQLAYYESHPEIDVVGGQISEFYEGTKERAGDRIVPCSDAMIKNYMKRRCPMNHVSVLMKRESVLAVGNYRDWPYNEDYDLWIRMAKAGMLFANLDVVLVNVRVGVNMYARRGGIKYFRSEYLIQRELLKERMIGFVRFAFNVMERFIVQLVLPNGVRSYVYRYLARSLHQASNLK